jgi:hypothetical protein
MRALVGRLARGLDWGSGFAGQWAAGRGVAAGGVRTAERKMPWRAHRPLGMVGWHPPYDSAGRTAVDFQSTDSKTERD